MSNAGGFKSLNRYYDMLAGNATFIDSTFDSIQTVTVGVGGQADITFSSIPSTYKHLQVRYTAQSNRGTYGIDNSKITINSDTGSNYSFHILNGDGAGAFSSGSASQTFIKSGDRDLATTTSTNIFGVGIIDFLDYTNTNKYKTTRTLSGEDINGTIAGFGGGISLASGLWMNTAAITSIKLVPQNGTLYTQYSSFALYGIRG
jgi:hypothetical protein